MKTMNDILKEMRKRCIDEKHSPELWGYIDRIEAAYKREVVVAKMETTTPTDKESLAVGNGANMHEMIKRIRAATFLPVPLNERHPQGMLDIRAMCDTALSAPPEPIGNTAKMREALKKADNALSRISGSAWFMDANFGEMVEVVEAGKAIRQALSAPPRNCDKYTTFECAARAFVTELAGADVGVGDVVEDMVGNWLFAEAKGGAE